MNDIEFIKQLLDSKQITPELADLSIHQLNSNPNLGWEKALANSRADISKGTLFDQNIDREEEQDTFLNIGEDFLAPEPPPLFLR